MRETYRYGVCVCVSVSQIVVPGVVDDPGVKIIRHQYDHHLQFYIAHLEEPLKVGDKAVLSMDFEGHLNDQLHGFYRSTYRDADGTEK